MFLVKTCHNLLVLKMNTVLSNLTPQQITNLRLRLIDDCERRRQQGLPPVDPITIIPSLASSLAGTPGQEQTSIASCPAASCSASSGYPEQTSVLSYPSDLVSIHSSQASGITPVQSTGLCQTDNIIRGFTQFDPNIIPEFGVYENIFDGGDPFGDSNV